MLDHLPRRKAQEAFGGHMEHGALLDPVVIDDVVMDYNNARIVVIDDVAMDYNNARIPRSP